MINFSRLRRDPDKSTHGAPHQKDLPFTIDRSFIFTLFPKGKALYHGTIANTEKDPSKYNRLVKRLIKIDELRKTNTDPSIIKAEFKKIKTGVPFYVSSKADANRYGINKDTSFVVSALHHSIERRDARPNRKHIVPLYCVNGSHGITIEFSSKKELKLFDLGNLDNMHNLLDAIRKCASLSDANKKENVETLVNTCFDATLTANYDVDKILHCKRKSFECFDPQLVKLLCVVGQTDLGLPPMDGWIYFPNASKTHHFEILLCDPFKKLLEYKKIHRVEDTVYDGIPTWDELKALFPKNTKPIGEEVILSINVCPPEVDYDKSESKTSPFYNADESS